MPVRKPGKLPAATVKESYALEYGTDSLEVHEDAVTKGQNVLIVDDVIATGGTAKATSTLVRRLGGHVHAPGVPGRARVSERTQAAQLANKSSLVLQY